jgi:hypothetical protein
MPALPASGQLQVMLAGEFWREATHNKAICAYTKGSRGQWGEKVDAPRRLQAELQRELEVCLRGA